MRPLVGLALLFSLPALADPPPSSDVLSGVPVSIEITSHTDPGRFMGDDALMLATATIAGSSPSGGVAVVLTIDLSQSTILADVSPEDCGGDVNNDGLYDTYLDCEITGATLVIEQMAEGGFVDEVAVVFFEKNEASADLSPASGIQTFVSPSADADSDSVLDVVEVLRSMKWYTTGTFTRFAGPSVFTSINAGEHNGGTAIGLGLQEACDVLGGSSADDQRVILFTDGHNNKNPHLDDVLPCDPNVPVYAFGLGPDGECTDGSEVTFGELANHVPGTGGACYDISSVYTLPDVLGGFFTPEVTAARAILDGGTPVNLTTGVTPALPYEGFGEVDLSWLAEGLDDEHEICFELDVEVGTESGTIGDCVTIELNTAPTLALGSDLVVDEGDIVTLDLSGADDPDDDPLNTIWEVLTIDGPALAAPSEGQQAASWLALDDGSYEVTLTVDDGLADDADTVTITVRNEDPEVAWSFFDGTGSGVVSLAGQVHDPGLMDVPAITIDWGDGDLETIDPAAEGPGWSAFVAGHAYLDPGAYTVVLTVDDHDGGVFVDMASAHHSPPVAVWATSTTLRKSLEWSGCSGTITGHVHSNQDLWLGGGGKAIDGVVEHVGGVHVRGDVTLSDAPAVGEVAPSPVQFVVAAWRPGGTKAAGYGDAWHNASSECVSGTWTVDEALPPGVYYANCAIVIDTDDPMEATFVGEGRVELLADEASLSAYGDALALLSASTADDAVRISGGGATVYGYLAAPAGGVEVGGELLTLSCGVVADRVDLAGSGLVIDADVCNAVAPTNLPPVLVPGLTVALDTEPASVHPTETVTASATVSFDQGWLVIPAIVGVQNLGDATITVEDLTVSLSAPTGTAGAWESLVLDVDWEATPLPTAAGPGDELEDAEVAAQTKAYWAIEAVAHATDADLDALMAAAASGEVKAELSLDLDNPTSEPLRLVGSTGSLVLSPAGSDVEDAEVVMLLTDGTARTLNEEDESDLGELEPDESVEVEALAAPPELAPIGGSESDSEYIERLLRADGSPRRTQAFAMGTFAGQKVFGAMVVESVTLDVPVLRLLGPEVPEEAAAGDVLDVRMTVTNVSETEAVAVAGERSVGATTVAPSLASSLDPDEVTDASGTHTLTTGVAGTTVSVVREVVWEDGAGNSYGPLSLNSDIDVDGLPAMALTLVDSLHTDADSNGVITEGDTVQLQVVVKAGPSAGLTSVEVELPLVEDLTLASATVTQGSYGTSTAGDVTTVTFTVGSLSANGTATLNARFVVLTPSPVFLTHQATGEATGLTGVLSDDPMLPGHADPTTTRVIGTDAELESWLGWRLLTDIDGNGVPSPGDTIRYEGAVSNGGLAAADDVVISIPVDPGSTLVAGTAWASAGSVTSGSLSTDTDVEISITSIAGQSSATWRYDVTVGFLASLVEEMVSQGELTMDTDPAGWTDDPRTEAAGDETVIPVSTTPYPDRTGYAGPWPTVEIVSPEPGSRLGVPTDIVAEVAPTDGEDVVYWRAVVWEDGLDREPTLLAYGLTDPPAPPLALATLDTTLLRNGLYTVRVEVIDSAGLIGWADAPVEVAGDFKPGAMRVAFVDGSYTLPVGGDIQVVRVYDNLDRHVSGDFGFGWHLELLGMRIQTNGPLGQGGWTQVSCGVGMFYGTQCFEAVKPHLVVLTWPDGSQESWDFLPEPVSSYFNALVEPGFVPRAGTTSSLAVAPGTGTGFFVSEDGNIYSGLAGEGGYYEPAAYVVTTTDGTQYAISVAGGLQVITDRLGNTVTFDDEGITANPGPDLIWERDGLGRITSITFPDDSEVAYAFTVGGDLETVTDQVGDEVTFTWDGDHRLVSWAGDGRPPAATWEYDEEGRVISSEDGEGVGTTLSDFDLEELTVNVVGPDPGLTTIEAYDVEGNVVSVTKSFSGTSYLTGYAYDEEYRVIEVTHPSEAVETFVYDGAGRVIEHEGIDGVETTTTYDGFGNVTSETVNGAVVHQTTYDADGRPLTDTDASGAVTTYTWTDGLLTGAEFPDGRVVEFGYDAFGRRSEITIDGTLRAEETHDVMGRITDTWSIQGGSASYVYDDAGRVVSRTSPLEYTQSITYDGAGRVSTYADPASGTVSYAYDAAGQLIGITDRNAQEVTRTYDAGGRVTSVIGPDIEQEYTYDPLGRLLTAVDGDVTVTRTWTAAGLATETLSIPGLSPVTTTYTTDSAGRTTAVAFPGGSQNYGYDARGRLSSVEDSVLGSFSFARNSAGEIASISLPGGWTRTWTRDALGRPTSATTSPASGPAVHTMSWTYAREGGPLTRIDPGGAHTFVYDSAGRLLVEDQPPGSPLSDAAYSYDEASRRTSWPGNSVAEVDFDSRHRLIQDASWTYAYDAEGRRTGATSRAPIDTASPETWAMTWDALGRLRTVEAPGGAMWTYTYDALGRRIGVDAPEGTRWYVYDGELARAELDETGDVTRRWVTGLAFGDVLAEVEDLSVRFAIRDGLGTPVAWLDPDTGEVSETIRDSYGRRAVGATRSEPYGFTGHAEDSNGLIWGRDRYLDVETGTWLSEDRAVDEPRYAYVGGRVLSSVDPDGTSEMCTFNELACRAMVEGLSIATNVTVTIVPLDRVVLSAVKSVRGALRLARIGMEAHKVIQAEWVNTGGWAAEVYNSDRTARADLLAKDRERVAEIKPCSRGSIFAGIQQLKGYSQTFGAPKMELVIYVFK